MSARHAATCSRRRRVGVQVALGQPHRADVHRVPPTSAGRAPRTSSVEPPPMSTTSTGGSSGVRRSRTAPSNDQGRLLVARQHLGSTPEPRRARRRGRRRRCAASRVAEVAQNRTPGDVVRRDQGGVLVDRRERARQRLVGEPAGRVDALAEPDHPRLAHAAPCRQVGDQQLDGVGAAVDRGDPGHGVTTTQGPSAHQSPSRSSTSSPSGFTPGPAASACAASTCRHLTRSGMPPAEMPSISGTSPSAARSAR